jgi:putative sterol carrier protein/acyl-coenzyme A thioesterase PaaI-like protein
MRAPLEELNAVVAEGSDEEVLAVIAELGGTQRVLEQLFGQAQLDPAEARDCIVCLRLADSGETHRYAIVVRDDQATISEGEMPDANLIFESSVPDFLRLTRGRLDPMKALLDGRLRVDGDVVFAGTFRRMFVSNADGSTPSELAPGRHTHAANCFGCGPNDDGLGLTWETDGRTLTSTFELRPSFEGPPGHAHGGIVASVFDELLVELAQHVAFPSLTTKLEVTFLRPVPLATALDARCTVAKTTGRSTVIEGVLEHRGTVLARAVGLFGLVPDR